MYCGLIFHTHSHEGCNENLIWEWGVLERRTKILIKTSNNNKTAEIGGAKLLLKKIMVTYKKISRVLL